MKILILSFIVLTSIACSKKGGGGSGIVINPPNTPVVAPTISYANYTQNANTAVSVVPVLNKNGQEVNCSISPALPSGLSLDPQTCVISGVYNDFLIENYVITASNSAGSTTAPLRIYIKTNDMIVKVVDLNNLELYLDNTDGFSIDWGDGYIEEFDSINLQYPFFSGGPYSHTAGQKYTVKISGGTINQFIFNSLNYGEIEVVQWGNYQLKNTQQIFTGFLFAKISALDYPQFAPNANASYMFSNDYGNLTLEGNLSDWDVSNVSSMWRMFLGVQGFNQDLSMWNVSNVTNCTEFDFNSFLYLGDPAIRSQYLPKFTQCSVE